MNHSSLILSLPGILMDPQAIQNFMKDPANLHPNPITPQSHRWNPLSLAEGFPGILVFFSALQNEEIAHLYVLKIKQVLESEGIPLNHSLFEGLGGICFAIQMASQEGKNYQKILQTLHHLLLNKIEIHYLSPLWNNIRTNTPSCPSLYDTIQGLSGIGRYTLENLLYPGFAEMTQNILKALIALTKPLSIEGHRVPGWYISPGNINLGLAHGIPGVLSFLSIALLKGMEEDGQKEAIASIASWIVKYAIIEETIRWPYSVSLDEEIFSKSGNASDKACRDAWCYGGAGVSRALFLAGKALSDENLKQFARKSFFDIFRRSPAEWNLPGPGICHGIAGLLLIANQMAREEGCETLNVPIADLTNTILSYYNPDHPFGFKDLEPTRDREWVELSKPGLLDGAAGIYLTLFSMKNLCTKWHLPFLISE